LCPPGRREEKKTSPWVSTVEKKKRGKGEEGAFPVVVPRKERKREKGGKAKYCRVYWTKLPFLPGKKKEKKRS